MQHDNVPSNHYESILLFLNGLIHRAPDQVRTIRQALFYPANVLLDLFAATVLL